jgi:hypothetical protein
LLFVLLQESFFFFLGRERCLLVVWFSDLHYYQRLVISFAGCLLQDSSFFLGIRKMDYGGASKQEEGEHACYTLILLQEWSFEEEGRETFQSMVSTVSGVLLGIAIGVSFKKVKWLLLGYQI